MEGLNTLLDLLSGSEFFTTIDLKDAYFSIPIHADHYKYLRFEWNSTLFEFICLPFGLSLAPRVFTKVLKPFVASIRNKGIRLVIYLDDMAIISSSRELSSQEAGIVVQFLESLGFIINKEKSVLFPSQKIVFLGYVIDSVARTVPLPEEKLNKDGVLSAMEFQVVVCCPQRSKRCMLIGLNFLQFFSFVRQNPNKAQGGGSSRWSSHSTLVAKSTLVPTAPPIIGPASYSRSSTPVGRAPNSASGGFSSPSQRCNAPSRVACIRDNLQVRGISPRAASYVLKSWRPGTEKQYSAAWKCFCCWCDRKQRNPLQADLGTVCDFLTEQFEDSKKSYSTINSYRSALSSMLLPVDGYSVGEHPIIARLLKGMFHIRPPEPRTASIRQSLNSSLFVSYGKPYKVVSSATLARWLKVVLSLAGIDTSIFKCHSFRGASTSKAVSLGVPLDVILKAADWKNAGTFAKFYQRETSSVGQFAQAVLTL
ncbi:Gag-Pol polyprotein [Acropora cervicornis]|uniref:Gag-Pol polyprotein n=1 Tax=Acropora cervicornis TaxID=6130 RepID=A0AAD9Q324_ACRCE|nr:Gag-Pol polyprotein [Acropora cervicornis]